MRTTLVLYIIFFLVFSGRLSAREYIKIESWNITDSMLLSKLSDSAEVENADTLSATGGQNIDECEPGIIQTVYSLTDFVDSIIPSLPDTFVFPQWDYVEIHDRKYDFYNVTDTHIIVLSDTLDCGYSHPVENRVTSNFGVRKWRFHYGTDMKLNTGDPVYSCWDGVIRISQYSRTYGHVVVVRHDNGLETLYAHLSKRLVTEDSLVHSGEPIGLGGNTGRSYGSHLHFEIRYFDEAIDPCDIIDFENYCLKSDTLLLSANNYLYRDKIKELEKIVFHKVRKGDTLSHMAVRYGTTITAICSLNGISRKKTLRIGQRFRVR